MYSLERIMHDYFAAYRKPNSEWFEGITFESAVDYLVKLTSSDEFVRCNAIRDQFNRIRNNETTENINKDGAEIIADEREETNDMEHTEVYIYVKLWFTGCIITVYGL